MTSGDGQGSSGIVMIPDEIVEKAARALNFKAGSFAGWPWRTTGRRSQRASAVAGGCALVQRWKLSRETSCYGWLRRDDE